MPPQNEVVQHDETTDQEAIMQRESTIVSISENDGVEEEQPTPPPRMSRRYSLVQQASVEKYANEGLKRSNTIRRRNQLEGTLHRGKQIVKRLNDEGIDLIWTADTSRIHFAVVLTSKATISQFLRAVLESFEKNNIEVDHLETRKHSNNKSRNNNNALEWDVFAECVGNKEELLGSASLLATTHQQLTNIQLFKTTSGKQVPWFPRHISELDNCSTCVTKYEPTTDPRHPGHGDDAYIARRQFLNDQAINFKYGDEIQYVDYTKEEHETWTAVYHKLKTLHVSHTCKAYRDNLRMLEDEGVLTPDRIPQIADVNRYLQKKTGFMLRPCCGLLSARDFLASLAFRVFQTTTYLRHSGSPHHSPEPDLIHELLGHVPMFSDPLIAQMSQDIGLMSLGASDEQIEKLATVYWFIIEFGLCREDGQLKAIGAGLLSAYGELMHACSEVPEHREFDPVVTAVQKYEDDDYQPLYFVANSIQDALVRLREYAKCMEKDFGVVYDPFTMSIRVVERIDDLRDTLERFQVELTSITHAMQLVNKNIP